MNFIQWPRAERALSARNAFVVLSLAIGLGGTACDVNRRLPTEPARTAPKLSAVQYAQLQKAQPSPLRSTPPKDGVNQCYSADLRDSIGTYKQDTTVLQSQAGTTGSSPQGRFFLIRWNNQERQTEFVVSCVIQKTKAAKDSAVARFRTAGLPQKRSPGFVEGTTSGDESPSLVDSAHEPPGTDEPEQQPESIVGIYEDQDTSPLRAFRSNAMLPSTPLRGQTEQCWYSEYDNSFECDETGVCTFESSFWSCGEHCNIIEEFGYDDDLWYFIRFCFEIPDWMGPSGNEQPPNAPVATVTCEGLGSNPAVIVRGDGIYCSILSLNYGTMHVWKWHFQPVGFYSYLDTVNHPNPDNALRNWVGDHMVAGGILTVTGDIGGDEFYPYMNTIAVKQRDTSTSGAFNSRNKMRLVRGDTSNDCHPTALYLHVFPHFGHTHGIYCPANNEYYYLAPNPSQSPSAIPSLPIASGPNTGYYYFTAIKDSLNVATTIHKDLRSSSPNLYMVYDSLTHGFGLNACHESIPGGSASKSYEWVNINCKENTYFYPFLAFLPAHENCHLTRDSSKYRSQMDLRKVHEGDVEMNPVDLVGPYNTDRVTVNNAIFFYGDSLHYYDATISDYTYHLWRMTTDVNWFKAIFSFVTPTSGICH